MRPAQLRRFASAATCDVSLDFRASMRPAQLRRFALIAFHQHVLMRLGFNEAGAAAPVCQTHPVTQYPVFTCFNEAGAAAPVCRAGKSTLTALMLLASMRPAQLRRFALERLGGECVYSAASMRPAQLRRFAVSSIRSSCVDSRLQ